jgi:hypothetical protein
MDILKIKSEIKSLYFNMILKITKSSKNDLKSDFVKSSIKSLNTLLVAIVPPEIWGEMDGNECHTAWGNFKALLSSIHYTTI